jgi:hypothetical protein
MATRVLFVGDASRGDQATNVHKLFRLFSPIFVQAGVECSVHVSAINALTKTSDWLESWRVSSSGGVISPLSMLDLSNVAVVGFEMPPRDVDYLDQQGVAWVNVEIHPIRFLDDLYFSITSSFGYDLSPISAGPGLVDFCANSIRIRYGRVADNTPTSALAIFGQTPFDRSVLFDGEFKRLDNYLDQLDTLAKEHERVLYRPHPFLSDPEVDEKIRSRYGARVCSERDVYGLLASGDIATACAISSSVIHEASSFGVKGVLLEPRAKRYSAPVSYALLLDEQSFWFHGLLGAALGPYRSIGRAVPPNFLRNTFSSWGYLSWEQETEAKLQQLEARVIRAETGLMDLLNSKTWKLTAPLRWGIRQYRALQRKLQ